MNGTQLKQRRAPTAVPDLPVGDFSRAPTSPWRIAGQNGRPGSDCAALQ
jgi:hypothetical protein